MMKVVSALLIALVFGAQAQSSELSSMSPEDVANLLRSKQPDISQKEIDRVVEQLTTFGKGKIKIGGALTSCGGDGAFFINNNIWSFDLSFTDPARKALVTEKESVVAKFYNGGIELNASFKCIYIFLPAGVTAETLEGKIFGGNIFGRGVSLNPKFFVGADLGILSGTQGEGDAYIFTPQAGLVGPSITFPKLEVLKVLTNTSELVGLADVEKAKLQATLDGKKKIIDEQRAALNDLEKSLFHATYTKRGLYVAEIGASAAGAIWQWHRYKVGLGMLDAEMAQATRKAMNNLFVSLSLDADATRKNLEEMQRVIKENPGLKMEQVMAKLSVETRALFKDLVFIAKVVKSAKHFMTPITGVYLAFWATGAADGTIRLVLSQDEVEKLKAQITIARIELEKAETEIGYYRDAANTVN